MRVRGGRSRDSGEWETEEKSKIGGPDRESEGWRGRGREEQR